MSILYHPDKANVVADDLIRMTMGSVSHLEEGKKDIVKDDHRLIGWVFGWKIPQVVVLWFITSLSNP